MTSKLGHVDIRRLPRESRDINPSTRDIYLSTRVLVVGLIGKVDSTRLRSFDS